MDGTVHLFLRCTVVLCALSCTACSTGLRLAYNNLDRLSRWQISNFVELEPVQKAEFDTAFDALWNWHRRTQLPAYAKDLREMAARLEQGAPRRDVAGVYLERIEKHGETLGEKALPDVERLLALLDGAQVRMLISRLRERIDTEERKLALETSAARRTRFEKRISEPMQWWIGDLNAEQKEAINRVWTGQIATLPSAERRRQIRLENLQRFAALLDSRRAPGFGERLRNFGDDDQSEVADQERMRALRLEIIVGLDERQRKKMRARMLGLAANFEALSTETVASVDRPGA